MRVFTKLFRCFHLIQMEHQKRLKVAALVLAVSFFFDTVYGQAPATSASSFTVNGVVKDSKGESLPGVTVRVKNTKTAVVTDVKGAYSLRVNGIQNVLVFHYIGFDTKEVQVGNNRTINVVMKESSSQLDEVVVQIGYGTSKRKDLTGSVEQVKMKELVQAPVKSFDEALAGRVAGVSVAANDGQPGSNNNIVIRGAGTLTQNASPLYVIDGFPSEDANSNSINSSDIESMEVLKDASATAIYGARGANGVIIITTKKGKIGAPVINYNGYYGFSKNPKQIEMMNAYEFVKYQAELEPIYAQNAYLNKMPLEDYRNVETINVQDEIYQSSPSHNHEISIRGGANNTIYSISGNVLDQTGLILNSGFRRYQGRFSLDQTLSKAVKIGTNVNYSATKTYGSIASETAYKYTYSSLALMYNVWGFRPVAASGESLIEEFFDPEAVAGDFRVNPIISAKNEIRETYVNNLSANAWVSINLMPGLTFRSSGGINGVEVQRNIFNNSLTANGNYRRVEGVNGSVTHNPINTWLNENILTYQKTFNKLHNLNMVGGFIIQKQTNDNYGLEAQQVLNESLGIDGLDEALTNINYSSRSRWTMASFLGRVNYNYKSKYYLTSSLRYDGSSKFAAGSRWAFFPSAALSWRMKEEAFLKDVDIVSDAKLRVSYGSTGNNRVSDFPYVTQLQIPLFGGYSFNNSASPTRGSVLASYGNPELKWETTVQANIGYDLALLKNRIQLTADVYRKTTKDLLIEANLPYSTGLLNLYNRAVAYKNVGKLQNQGLELTLNTVNVNKPNFKWNTNFNISFNQNKILELYEDISSISSQVAFDSDFSSVPSYISPVGQSAGQMYGLIWDGVYQYEDFDYTLQQQYILKDNIPSNGQSRSTIQPGDIKYRDINGDLKVDLNDFTVIGRGTPIHTGGFNNNFNYKGFDLNVFFQWSYGNDIVNANRLIFEGNAKRTRALNQYASYANRWQPDNPSNTMFRTGGQRDAYFSSRVVEDGSFLRLKTVSLGYNFDASLLRTMKLKTLRAYVSAQNLHTWTKYSGSNPDVSTRHSVLTPGFDFASYPLARTIVFGVSTSL